MVRNGVTPSGATRWRCEKRVGDDRRERCYSTTDPSAPYRDQGGRAKAAPNRNLKFRRKLKAKRYVVTWAQNGTPVDQRFFGALRNYCERNSAELIVIPGRYKNPTSQWTQAQQNAEVWADEVQPYLYNGRKKLNRNLVLLADIKSQPTAVSPLTGFEGLTHTESSIIGHPRLQLTTIATPEALTPKIMTTTGAVTIPNYTDTRAGKKGEFHHVLGAALVEIQNDHVFHLTQINARRQDGAFIVHKHVYYPDGWAEPCGPYLGLVLGDSHVRFRDKVVEAATFGRGGLVPFLDPKVLVFHDLLDAYAVNPHHVGDPFLSVAKHNAGLGDIRDEVEEAIAWADRVSKGREAVIVPSNHDDMLKRWLMREDWRRDPLNAEFYLETALQLVRTAKMTERGSEVLDPFGYWVEQRAKTVRALRQNESFTIGDIECGLHGHEGPNGARGSVKNLSKIGVKVISGHGHGPAIEGGHYRVGTSTPLSMEYTGPVGNWLNTHCAIDPFGKRHLHNIINGSWKL